MSRRLKQCLRLGLLSFVLLSLSVRVLIPAGYMPSAWADGGPFVICPDGLFNYAAVISGGHGVHGGDAPHGGGQGEKHDGRHSDHHGNHHATAPEMADQGELAGHEHDEANGHTSYSLEFCPIGSVLGAAAVPAPEAAPVIAWRPTYFRGSEVSRNFSSVHLSLYHARGPPQAIQVSA